MRLPSSVSRASICTGSRASQFHAHPVPVCKKGRAAVRKRCARQASACDLRSALFRQSGCAGVFSYSYMHQPIVERHAACRTRASAHPVRSLPCPVPFAAGVVRSSSSRARLVDLRISPDCRCCSRRFCRRRGRYALSLHPTAAACMRAAHCAGAGVVALLHRYQSQLSAPPVWYSMTRVSKKFFSFLRSIISDIHGKGLDAPENSRSRPICWQRRLAT